MRDPAGPPARVAHFAETARGIASTVLAEDADKVDGEAQWPARGLHALGEAGLLGLNVGTDVGGHDEGLLALAVVTEELGRECGSTGLVFGMHCVAAKVIDVKATDAQKERYLAPIAAGRHVTSLALSEPGTGVHFYLPQVTYRRDGDDYRVNGCKSFVTSGGRADSYVLSVVGEGSELDPGTFSCLLLDAGAPGATWQQEWNGFGMRGNSSRGVVLDEARVPAANLLGAEGDETWYVFEVIAPYFIVAMAGAYLGVARSALEATIEHVRKRTYEHTGERIGANDIIAHRLGGLWSTVERTRQLLHHAAALGDAGDPAARQALFACKAEVAEAAVHVANEALTLTGGIAYQSNSRLTRALRDARAAHVMSPSTDLLRTWLGRSLLDLPLL
ncbi:acyl-CoA dehydrogenase family protein [Egicoccus sp. AB-alg6-2]|uniref:acyl-CoA dehydrogenase family protein n=1 Tax=Egicoccus sp. AB-alg6-2 TaxID=3242692 RepID=UPI00359E39DD